MKLILISDLVDADLSKRLFDVRSRNSDGTLKYSHDGEHAAPICKLIKVYWKYQKVSNRDTEKSKWLFWEHDTKNMPDVYGRCNYSGTAGDIENYYIQEVEQ